MTGFETASPARGTSSAAAARACQSRRGSQLVLVTRPSDIGRRTSDVGHRTSDIGNRTSDLGHRAARLHHSGTKAQGVSLHHHSHEGTKGTASFYVPGPALKLSPRPFTHSPIHPFTYNLRPAFSRPSIDKRRLLGVFAPWRAISSSAVDLPSEISLDIPPGGL